MEALSILDKENGILVSYSRWQYALYWRKDGLPLWKNDALIAKEGNTKFTFHDAENLQLN
jgi:uncharacterized protein (DUF2126 family)